MDKWVSYLRDPPLIFTTPSPTVLKTKDKPPLKDKKKNHFHMEPKFKLKGLFLDEEPLSRCTVYSV